MKKFLFGFAAFIAVLVFANLAMAGTIDVDNNNECTDGTQASPIACGAPLVIWWNGTGSPSGSYCAELWDSNELVAVATTEFSDPCLKSNGSTVFSNFGETTLTAPSCAATGSFRVKVCEGACGGEGCAKGQKNTGGDSFATTDAE